MTPRPPHVSVIDPISLAFERVRDVLFRPFDIERWFTIGFCAWLAQLGEAGGNGSGGGNNRGYGGGGPSDAWDELRDAFESVRDYVSANAHWLIPVAIAAVMIFLLVSLLIVWLSSRGRFMFLHCVAQNKSEVKVPWRLYEVHAYSLFLFRLVLAVIGLVLFGGMIAAGVFLAISAAGSGLQGVSLLGIIALATVFVLMAIVFGVIAKFTKDFVVPIMYLHSMRCTEAWRVLLALVSANKGRFFVYLLFQIVMSIAIGVCVMMLACLTCGCACCFLILPYIGTVVLLPVHVFTRSYSLYYLGQYGPDFYAIAPEPQPAPPMDEPPM